MKNAGTIGLLLCCCVSLQAQDSSGHMNKWEWSGYVKSLQTISFDRKFSEAVAGNLLHNRLNIKYKPAPGWTLAAEFRNRFFWGEEISLTPGFSALLRNKNEKMDLSVTWLDRKNLVFHSNTERLWLEYRADKWSARAGRQRVNWGMTTTWNPNDIFNAYNFLDFDYEERPGADAFRANYQLSDFSGIETVLAFAGRGHQTVGAARYTLNRWQYDMQVIAGWFREHLTLGAGWAGNIGEAGFKGELQYFFKTADSADRLNVSTEIDYVFSKGWYLSGGLLFNSRGLSKPVDDWQELDLALTPENLMPTKWNLVGTTSKEFTPLFTGSLSVLYAPGTNLLILFPSLQYNLVTNLDASLTWQSFFSELDQGFRAAAHKAFIRLKWSF